MSFNVNKSNVMWFNVRSGKSIETPPVLLDGSSLRPYLLDLMLRGPDRLYFFSNEIILKITCEYHVMA